MSDSGRPRYGWRIFAKITNSEVPISPDSCPVPSALCTPRLQPRWEGQLGGWAVLIQPTYATMGRPDLGEFVDTMLLSGLEVHVHGAQYEEFASPEGPSLVWVYDVELVQP